MGGVDIRRKWPAWNREAYRWTPGPTLAAEDVRAWQGLARLMGDGWAPTPERLRALEDQPPEVLAALRSVSRGWTAEDARWDTLLALFEWFRG